MTKLTFIFFALLIATVAMADSELKLKAISEAETPRQVRTTATDVAIPQSTDGILSLQDPTPEFKIRSYDWLLGLKFQSFQPSGQLQSKKTQTVNLDTASSFYLPSLELGLRFPISEPQWHWGVVAQGGYNSHPTSVIYTDKSQDPEGQLTTILSDIGLTLEYDPSAYLGLQASTGAGVINYSQTGASSYSKITEDSTFQYFSVGLHLSAGSHWQVLLSYMNRNLLKPDVSKVSLPTDSAELGTRFLW